MNVLVDTGVWYVFFELRERPSERQVIVRLMLDDVDMKIDRFITFNAKDFTTSAADG